MKDIGAELAGDGDVLGLPIGLSPWVADTHMEMSSVMTAIAACILLMLKAIENLKSSLSDQAVAVAGLLIPV